MNEEIINKILICIDKSELTVEEKKEYKERLEYMKKDKSGLLTQLLEKTSMVCEKEPDKIKDVFSVIDIMVSVYLEKGARGLIEEIKQVNSKLDEIGNM